MLKMKAREICVEENKGHQLTNNSRNRKGVCALAKSMRGKGRFLPCNASYGPRCPVYVLLFAVVVFIVLSSVIPVGHAMPFRLRGGRISKPITVGRAVDSVLLDGVVITGGVPVVFDMEAMVPGPLRIDLKDCVCQEGSQIYVLGYRSAPVSGHSLVMNVSGLNGEFCSLVFAHKLPEQTNVTICDSTIAVTGPVKYTPIRGMSDAPASPLVLYATLLLHSKLYVINTILRTSTDGGAAIYVAGGVQLKSSMIVFDGMSLEALHGSRTYAMYVPPLSGLSLEDNSVFSVTNASVKSSGGGFAFGNRLTVSLSVLRFVNVVGRMEAPVVTASGGKIGDGGWLELYRVWALNDRSSAALLSSVTVSSGGVVSVARCAVTGKTLVAGPVMTNGGVVSVQCNRADGKLLRSAVEYRSAGLPSVNVVPCDGCDKTQNCFGALTTSFSECSCRCARGGAGAACLPPGVPIAKAGGAQGCVRGVALTESVTIGGEQATLCLEAVVFSGPITVTVDLRSMDVFADALKVTLRHCLLEGGAQLRIKGVEEDTARLMPGVLVNMENVTSLEGTILLQHRLPANSKVLLADSTLRATVNGSQYVPTTSGDKESRYGPVLVLDGVRLLSSQLVVTRSTFICSGDSCAAILVERDLLLDKKSSFYMDNCAVNAHHHVMGFIASKLTVGGGSVFAIQNNSWRVRTIERLGDAWQCESITITGGSVLQIAGNKFGPSESVIRMQSLTVNKGSWLVQRDNDFRVKSVFLLDQVEFETGSTWSVLRNNFLPVPGAYSGASMWNYFSFSTPPETMKPTVYVSCNNLNGMPLEDYGRIAMRMNLTPYGCGECTWIAEGFAAKAIKSTGNKCGYKCAADSYGFSCLPAEVPMKLGPRPPLPVAPAEIPCVRGGTVNELAAPTPGVSGLCFVGLHFTSPLVIDMSDFRPATRTINITLLQCRLSGLRLTGNSEYAVHMSMTDSTVDEGSVVFDGVFALGSRIRVVDSVVDTAGPLGIIFEADFGVNASILLHRTAVIATNEAIAITDGFILNASEVVVQGCRLEAAVPQFHESSAIAFKTVQIVSGGRFRVIDSHMIAGRGVALTYPCKLTSSALLEVTRNTMTGPEGSSKTALLYHGESLTISGGAELRVEQNRVRDALLYYVYRRNTEALDLVDDGSVAVFSHNVLEGSAEAVMGVKAKVHSPARLLAGCNKKNSAEVKYEDAFNKASVIGCGACKGGDTACRVPEAKLVSVAAVPRTQRDVDVNRSCVVDQTLKNISIEMWKTHHCYTNVTFSGVGAALKFSLMRMPLHLPINITFSGCTFLDGAAVHFVGGRDAVESAGVLIRMKRVVMQSSGVSFSNAFPRGTDIVINEIDAEQISLFFTPNRYSNRFAVVALKDFLLAGSSSLLLSNVEIRRPRRVVGFTPSGSCLAVEESLTLLGGSALYVQHCTLAGAKAILDMNGKTRVANRSVLALLNNVVLSGESILDSKTITVEEFSVFRMVGNRGAVRFGVYLYGEWIVRQSSWVELRENDVPTADMLRTSALYAVDIDNSSALTLTGCKMRAMGLKKSMVKEQNNSHKFVAGCLMIGEEMDSTVKDMREAYITGVTTAVKCGECDKIGSCFAPLTISISGCKCQCAAEGHGDVCAPSPLALSLPVSLLPATPAQGRCISDMVYPEVTQTVGGGLSWLCYRNVTFSGTFMRFTVAVGAMVGDAVSVIFDGCKWERGAALVLEGAANVRVGSLSIVVTRNSFEDAVLSPAGAFPPRTNITISGNHFNVTRAIPVPGVAFHYPSCVVTRDLVLSGHSALILTDNNFYTGGSDSVVVYVAKGGMAVQSYSAFAMTDNSFHVSGGGRAAFRVSSDDSITAVRVHDNSVFSVERSFVSGVLEAFVHLDTLEVKSKSTLLLERNVGLVVISVFHVEDAMELMDSWVFISKNAAYDNASVVGRFGSVKTERSLLVVSGNSVLPVTGGAEAAAVAFKPNGRFEGSNTSTLILACNKPAGSAEKLRDKVSNAFAVKEERCSDQCILASSCFPAYTTTVSSDGCACRCAEGGHGDHCLPVYVPRSHDDDPCVRNMNVTWDVVAGHRQSVVCYVGVTFAADFVVEMESMTGSVRNVTLANCTFLGGASLYVVGWRSDPTAGERADVLISGLESRSGGGVVVANRFPPGSRVTVVDSVLIAEKRVAYRGDYGLGDASACLVVHKVSLTGSVLTIARTHVAAVFRDAVGVLVVGGVALSSRGALYVDGLSVQTALGLCVSVEGGVAASGGSVVAFVDSDFLLCKHAVSVRGAVSVSGSAVALVRSDFVSTEDYAVAFYSTVSLAGGSMLLAKGNVHDGVSREMLYAAGAVTAVGSTLSFVRNRALLPRMLSLSLSLAAGAHLRVACNDAGGRVLSTAEEYAAAGFGDAGSIDVAGCDDCDRDTHCYAPGTASAGMRNGVCVCVCGSGGYGEACVPVGAPALPASAGFIASAFEIENTVVQSTFVVPAGVSEVTLRHVVLDGVSPVLYVPWMARDGVRIFVQNVSLRNGAVLYVMGGGGASRAWPSSELQLELSICSVEAFNGVIVLTGTFPAKSMLTMTESLLITTESTPLEYLLGSQAAVYTPALVLSGLQLVNSTLLMHGVGFLAVKSGGRTVIVDGAALRLDSSGVSLETASFGGDYAFYVGGRTVLSEGAVLRVSESGVYAGCGLLFYKGLSLNASAVVINDNTGALTDDALLVLRGSASFASGSWLSVRGNEIGGRQRLLSLPSRPSEMAFLKSTFALYGNIGGGSHVMNGTVAVEGPGGDFVVGCVRHNGQTLNAAEYESVGISGYTRTVACGACDARVNCFAAATRAMSGSCVCRCAEGGYGRDCLPVYLPHVDGCNRTVTCPALDVSILPGRGLTLEDIRLSGATPKKLTVALPPPFRWERDADLRPYLTFALASFMQPNGYSGPWGEKLRNATWERNRTNPRGVLEVTVPKDGKYFIGMDEKILLAYTPHALHGGCTGVLEGAFTINSNTPVGLSRALLVLNGVGASTAVAAIAAGGWLGPIVEMQALGVFAKMSCAPAWERASTALLPYFLSVFAALDPLWMVVGNALLAAVFGCVHYGVTAAFQRWRGVDAASAWAAMRFPSLTYLVAYVMHPGICVFSAFLLTMSDAQVQHYVLGVVGVLYGVAFPAGVCYFVSCRCDAEFKEYEEFSNKPFPLRWLYPVGYWYPAAQQRMYGSIFSHVRDGKAYMCVFQLSVLCVVGLIAAVRPPVGGCHVQYFCMAAVLFTGAGVVAYTNMMRSVFLTVMHTAGFVLLGALCIVNAANHLAPSDDGVRGHAAILLLLLCVVLAITVYSIVLWYVESRNRRALREQRKSPDYCLPDGKDEEQEEEKRIESHPVSPEKPTV
ncbi:hypothetical protein ECC02_003367 [Trypanosoma cruzi]|uniref:Dispersed gene family protein 1 (DGF-1) n=1 Tax=Trypanosoma cruzi TaxID=5693 RepID=A0A7J6YAQ5_TRYCR|nr:hypothetical protein ECC02_003367 [Trypanosoma cruzi]